MKKGTATEMLNSDNWYEDISCDGLDPTVNSTQSCYVPFETLRGSPFFYVLNDKIRVRVWAENLEGIGSY
jgi:spore germination protein YaaH